jgi:hypothetical protein
MTKSIQATKSRQVLKLVASLLLVCTLGIAIPNEGFACHKDDSSGDPRPHGKNSTCPPQPPPPDDGDPDAPSSYNLARADFATRLEMNLGSEDGGIFADGIDTCTVLRNNVHVTYDYWAWQESLLNSAESIH